MVLSGSVPALCTDLGEGREDDWSRRLLGSWVPRGEEPRKAETEGKNDVIFKYGNEGWILLIVSVGQLGFVDRC